MPLPDTPPSQSSGFTVSEVARRYRVSADKVRGWIKAGELHAINTAALLCGRPRWVVTSDALADFEKKRQSGPAPKTQRRRRCHQAQVDFYSD